MLPANLQGVPSLEHLRARVGGSELRAYAWSGERARRERRKGEQAREEGKRKQRRTQAGSNSRAKTSMEEGGWEYTCKQTSCESACRRLTTGFT